MPDLGYGNSGHDATSEQRSTAFGCGQLRHRTYSDDHGSVTARARFSREASFTQNSKDRSAQV